MRGGAGHFLGEMTRTLRVKLAFRAQSKRFFGLQQALFSRLRRFLLDSWPTSVNFRSGRGVGVHPHSHMARQRLTTMERGYG